MNGRRVEHPHNTPEQVREYLREALDVVDELGPPDDLRVPCFTSAVKLISNKHVTVEAVGVGIPGMAIPRGM